MFKREPKGYELPMSRDYVRHWGMTEAIRELLQNAIDGHGEFVYLFNADVLRIISRNTSLSPRTLVLGGTTKADDKGSIGSFGEGYKLALLVLTRLGLPVTVFSGNSVWSPEFRHSDVYGTEVLFIRESPAGTTYDDLEFAIGGLSEHDIERIKDSCLLMQEPMPDAIHTRYGRILPSKPGKLYVGGLFVCDTDTTFGYDFLPEHLRLERDRQTVSGFDLKFLTKNAWFDTNQFTRIADLMKADTPDLEYAEYGCPELLKEACYKLFISENPGAIAVKSQVEVDYLVKRGFTKTVYVNSSFHSAISSSTAYRNDMAGIKQLVTPSEALDAWYSENKKYMSRLPSVSFKKLRDESSSWIAR